MESIPANWTIDENSPKSFTKRKSKIAHAVTDTV
jgi:hypothetical protein